MTKKYKLSILLLTALLGACNLLEPVGDPCHSERSEESLVPVSLTLDVAAAEDGMPGSKADIYHEPEDPGYDAEAAIRTVLLLQFDGEDADAQLIGQQQYFDHWPLVAAQGEGFALVARSTPQTVVVIANSFGYLPLTDHTTLGNFLENENYREISSLASVWRDIDHDGDRLHYLQMGGHYTFPSVTASTAMNLTLRRNCAKVVINVKNEAFDKTGDNKVIIEDVQLFNVNAKHYYVTDFATDAGDAIDFRDPFSNVRPMRFDASADAFASNDGTVQSFAYYVPANLRGQGSNTDASATQKGKNLGAPLGATGVRIYAHYGDDSKPIVYIYYLGGDLVNDFDVKPNYKYTYNITLSGKGTPANDYRIEDLGDRLTFKVDANCYMLQPPLRAGEFLTYAIPVRRAAVFWNPSGYNLGVYGAAGGDNEVLTLNESTSWTAAFVWNEIYREDGTKADAGDLLVGSVEDNGAYVVSGKGFDPQYAGDPVAGHDPYIRIRVQTGMKGNALVAVRNAEGIILWSWHIWVTDYNPDMEVAPVAGTYVYPVPGGAVHRYNNSYWAAGGVYEHAFIMDRNLGATAETGNNRGVGVNASWGFHYVWGRKDPFMTRTKWTTPVNWPDASEGGYNITYSVHHPTTWLDGGAGNRWTKGGVFPLSDDAAVWNDPKLIAVGHGGDGCEANKSIYDPCPPGWKVPGPGAALTGGFTTASGDARTVEYTSSYGEARLCYPGGYDNRATKGTIFFPVQDTFFLGARVQRNDSSCNYPLSSHSEMLNVAKNRFGVLGFIENGGNNQSGTGPVRCVRNR